MEGEEQRKDDLDLGGGEQTAGKAEDPLAGVPAGPVEDVSSGPDEERLGGDGAAIGEEPEPEPGEFMEEPEEPDEQPEPEPEPQGEAETPAPASGEESSTTPPPASEGNEGSGGQTAEPAAEEPPEPAKGGKPKAGKKAGKAKTQPREYKVLRVREDGGIESPLKGAVKARNGDEAIKEAYKALCEAGGETMTLVAIPTGYYKPKEVTGREKKDYAVEVK